MDVLDMSKSNAATLQEPLLSHTPDEPVQGMTDPGNNPGE